MKKTIITMMLLTAFPVFAQSVAVTQPSPNAPVQPVLTISPNAVTALGSNTTNRVFVDQSGENPDISITQTGVGNTVGANATYTKGITNIPQRLVGGGTRNFTVDTPMYLRGADQDITVVQTGNNNTVSLRAENPTSSGDGVSINIQQIGDSNFVDASCGGGSSSTGTALTTCKDATISWKWTGNSNVMQFKGTGDSLNSQVEVTGNSNEMYIDAVGDKHSQVIKVAGDYNVFNISQTANSTNGSSVWIDLTGNSNKFAISQAGTQDNVIHIKSVANTGNWNIVQRTTQ
jgi:hypothetical protein